MVQGEAGNVFDIFRFSEVGRGVISQRVGFRSEVRKEGIVRGEKLFKFFVLFYHIV